MKYPKLKNIKELIINPDATPKIEWAGSGEIVALNQLESLAQDIRKIKNKFLHTEDGRRQFDQLTAELLGNKLKINPVVAADAEFWQLFTTIYALDIVLWRWNKDNIQLLSKDRITGKWKDTFKRLWFRSFLTKENYLDDSNPFCKLGDEDFWVGVIERELSACKLVVIELLKRWYIDNSDKLPKTEYERETIKIIRQIHFNRLFEAMSQSEAADLVDQAIRIAIPIVNTNKKKKKDSKSNFITDTKNKINSLINNRRKK